MAGLSAYYSVNCTSLLKIRSTCSWPLCICLNPLFITALLVLPVLCYSPKANNNFTAFTKIFFNALFATTQLVISLHNLECLLSIFWMWDLATEKGAKERQNLCGWLEISHLEIYPSLCTTSCFHVFSPNCYTWVLPLRYRCLILIPKATLGYTDMKNIFNFHSLCQISEMGPIAFFHSFFAGSCLRGLFPLFLFLCLSQAPHQ